MSVESDLRKDGIEVIKKLDTLRINSIARFIYKIIKIKYVYCKNA